MSDDTLRFDGYIEEGEQERFRKVYNQNIKNLMVRSGGGSGIEGTKLGFELARADLTVVVDGPCLSSCANYVFLAGKKKIIRGGCVGFHGSGNALCAMNADIDKENCEKFADAIKQEEKFFELVGVNPELFKRSQTEDKGMADGKTHSVLMLTAKTFERSYGLSPAKHLDETHPSLLEEYLRSLLGSHGA